MRRLVISAQLALLGVLAGASGAQAAGGAPLPDASARLQGTFSMNGRITTAKHIRGEHRGEEVSRSWSFAPQCPAGPCSTVQVTRRRPGGSDTTVLTATSRTTFVGKGLFYAPLRCDGRVRPHGESVPFTLKVKVTSRALVLGVPVASAIRATYVNRSRRNLTRCVDVPGHDAAAYDGTIVSGS